MEEIQLGETATCSKRFTAEDVRKFAEVTGDFNPVHFDEEYANNSILGGIVVHGSLVTSLASGLLGMQLPGVGTVAYEMQCRFRQPVYPEDTVTVCAEVIKKNEARNLVTFRLTWVNQTGLTVAHGEAVVMPPRKG